MLDDFVCDAVHPSGVPQVDPKKSGKNEGIRIVEELAFERKSENKVMGECGSENRCKSMPQRLSDFQAADLIPETREWNEGKGVDLGEWLWRVGSFEHAIGYGKLFWPEFTEFDDCVFGSGFSQECYYVYMRQGGGDKQAVEATMNHRHILDLFSHPERQPTQEQIVYLGRLLKEMWTTKLYRDFPSRRFVVSFVGEPCSDLVDYIITFFQESHSHQMH